MTQYTPGPWEQESTLIFAREAKSMICELSEPRGPDVIRHERLSIGSSDWGEAMANGKLMAAAPEMLAALEAFMHADALLNRDVEFERRFERAVILTTRALEKIDQ